jgi:hypothetical protein
MEGEHHVELLMVSDLEKQMLYPKIIHLEVTCLEVTCLEIPTVLSKEHSKD